MQMQQHHTQDAPGGQSLRIAKCSLAAGPEPAVKNPERRQQQKDFSPSSQPGIPMIVNVREKCTIDISCPHPSQGANFQHTTTGVEAAS